MNELPKAYDPASHENNLYKRWVENSLFSPETSFSAASEAFSIVLPPPNVTGTLHMGHAAMLAIEDTLVRYHRMKGDRTLWVPGTDHAAIATQSKVEKLIAEKEKKTKYDLGRAEFLKRVQTFAQESHDTIVNQCKKMGASLDWSREAYTLDEVRNRAVRLVFKQMHDDGLIYQGHRIVNWDPIGQTTVSDDEIVYKEEKTKFYYFQYGPFVIGTARPETKFGDKYVVVHPDDERYAEFKSGQTITLEWINGPITATVIKDEAIDKEFGTGAMTITPWHSTIDFEIAERHGLDKEQIIDEAGKLLPVAGEFAGEPIATARQKIVEKLRTKGLVVKEEDYVHQVATAERSGGLIEPQIKKQWFIGVNKKFTLQRSVLKDFKAGDEVTLKQLMQSVVRSGEIKIIPDRFEKTYFSWIDNLRDWCISRQIWFGHQVPVWYRDEEMVCAVDAPTGEGWVQDSDTLDTWFSSGLWSFSTLLNKGILNAESLVDWVKQSPDIAKFHPTSVLETGYDIIFFWVARMILMTTYALGDVPFKTVYLHGLVRDEQGRKMSKSLGNIINPLDMIERYGTDATRLSLLLGNTPGNDMKLSEEKIAGFRNFTNKLWNMARFMLGTGEIGVVSLGAPVAAKTKADEWILVRLNDTVRDVTRLLEEYQLSSAGEILRTFTWDSVADWYLEVAKIEGGKKEILGFILETVLKLWHPFMPFVTEAIWREWRGEESFLMVQTWPKASEHVPYHGREFERIQNIVTGIRTMRAEQKIEPAKKIGVVIRAHGEDLKLMEECQALIKGLRTGVETITIGENVGIPPNALSFPEGAVDVMLDISAAIDVEKEKTRLTKEVADVERYVLSLKNKLANDQFINHAPPTVVEAERVKYREAEGKLAKLVGQLAALRTS